MTESDILILYCPGSRGDFLAAVLTDKIDQSYQQYKQSMSNLHYYKMHSTNEGNNPWHSSLNETSILQHKSRSIRIKIAPSDYDFIAHLATTKKLQAIVDSNDVRVWEEKYRKLDIDRKSTRLNSSH